MIDILYTGQAYVLLRNHIDADNNISMYVWCVGVR